MSQSLQTVEHTANILNEAQECIRRLSLYQFPRTLTPPTTAQTLEILDIMGKMHGESKRYGEISSNLKERYDNALRDALRNLI